MNNLMEDIYNGIRKAHPNISQELCDEYARIALYMIRKNKTEMRIHAPKKSLRRLKIQLLQLKIKNHKETPKYLRIIK